MKILSSKYGTMRMIKIHYTIHIKKYDICVQNIDQIFYLTLQSRVFYSNISQGKEITSPVIVQAVKSVLL